METAASGSQADTEAEKDREKKERILARRKRVEAKLEAKRRAEAGEEPEEVVEEKVDEEKERVSWKQVQKSSLRLDKLSSDGTELVSNVVVAEDAREVQARQELEEAHNTRYEKLEAEALAGEERFEEIVKKWDATTGKTIPQDLQKLIVQQKAACDGMTDEKDKLVTELQQELKSRDDQYVKYLKRQAEEVDLVLERMEEQAHTLLKAHRQEMDQIESTFATERETLKERHKAEWDEAVAKRRSREAEFLARREERIDENETQVQYLRHRNMQEFNKTKISLETDIQTLQQQIQQMKATYLLNAEKLEYNFQVLKKRDEENTATISLQKRRITRLQDTHSQLSSRLKKQSRSQQAELQALMEEYRKNTEQFRDVQKKARHFQMSDTRLFQEVWAMNEGRVRELAGEVLEADRIMHSQQLGLEWVKPCEVPSPMERALATARSKMSQATIYASQVLSETDGSVVGKDLEESTEYNVEKAMVCSRAPTGEEEGKRTSRAPTGEKEGKRRVDTSRAPTAQLYPPSVVKRVLELLCREAGFLLDGKLIRLVAPLVKEEQMMLKLDSMFKSLGVHTEGDIHHLVGFFVKQNEDEELGEEVEDTVAGNGREGEKGGEREGESLSVKMTGDESEEEEIPREGTSHTLPSEMSLIHPNDIPSALRQFIEHRKSTAKPASLSPSALGLASAAHKELLDGSFWQQMKGVLPQSHEKVWDALLEGLEQYHSVLVSRHKAKEETQALKNQNIELRLLLQHYMHSRVNEELEIPPTFMLPT